MTILTEPAQLVTDAHPAPRAVLGQQSRPVAPETRTQPHTLPHTQTNAQTDAQTMVLSLFGGFELTIDGRPVLLPFPVQRLVAFLALHRRPLQRGFVAGSLYLDKSEVRANGNLRSTLWRAHQFGPQLIHIHGNVLSLADGARVDVDSAVVSFHQLLQPDPGVDVDEDRLLDELLPDWYDDWVITERERLRQLRLHALEALCVALRQRRLYARAVNIGVLVTTAEPLRESAHRALIEVHLAEGNVAEAVAQYHRYAAALREELGIEPSPQIWAMLRVPAGR